MRALQQTEPTEPPTGSTGGTGTSIYGPDYEERRLDRLRSRGLGHKRSTALREYALGLEALYRVARNEFLWRVHECVFKQPVKPLLAVYKLVHRGDDARCCDASTASASPSPEVLHVHQFCRGGGRQPGY